MGEQCRLITKEQLEDYKKNAEAVEILKKKLIQAKPELREWVEMHFGRVKE